MIADIIPQKINNRMTLKKVILYIYHLLTDFHSPTLLVYLYSVIVIQPRQYLAQLRLACMRVEL